MYYIGGVIVVGLGDLLNESETAKNPLLGDIISVIAMLFWAGQICYEEKFVKKYKIHPLFVIGCEGFFSLIILTFLLFGFYFLQVPFDMGQPNKVMEDAIDGFVQLGNNPILLTTFIGKKSYITTLISNYSLEKKS